MSSNAAGWTGASGEPTTVLLVRHGQTPLSVERRYSGRGNPHLTELGMAQANAVADVIKKWVQARGVEVADIATSPLQRCVDTAAAIAKATGAPVREVPQLIETDFGAWEGLTFAEAAARFPAEHREWLGDPGRPAPEGESFADVRARVLPAFEKLTREAGGRMLVVVTHVTPIKLVLQDALAAGPELLYRLHLDLAQISELHRYPDGGVSVHQINATAHLEGL